jgi:hypothetical protein
LLSSQSDSRGEAEPALVDANRELIARFDQKIQATLARIWGEGESANGAKPYQPEATPLENSTTFCCTSSSA